MARLLALLMLLAAPALFAAPAWAVEPDEILDDPALEQRARGISANLRCVVCQNEPIDTSNADMAKDLRVLVRERLVAGDTNEEVYGYVQARYGDYVLFRPPFKPSTYALWLVPFALMGAGILGLVMAARRRLRVAGTPALTEAERAELDRL